MKKIIKNPIFTFILGLIVMGSVGVVASTIFATNVTYDNTVSGLKDSNNQDVTTVQGAIDALTIKANNSGFCKKITGNATTIGSKYECDPGDGTYRVFYVLKVNTDTVDLIMDRNINSGTVDWSTASTYFVSGAGSSLGWSNVTSVALPKAQDIANAVGNSSWNINTATSNDWFYFDKNGNTYGQNQVANQNNISAYSWLYEHTRDCVSYGCSTNTSLDSSAAYGYWIFDEVNNETNNAWYINRFGGLTSTVKSDAAEFGVRPVITVAKSAL